LGSFTNISRLHESRDCFTATQLTQNEKKNENEKKNKEKKRNMLLKDQKRYDSDINVARNHKH